MRRTIVRKGTKIVCPLCKRVIGEVTEDLRSGDVISGKNIRIYGVELKIGDRLLCPYCGFPFGVETPLGGLIHTEHGWAPKLFPDDAFTSLVIGTMYRLGMWRREWDEYLRG